MSKTQTTGVRMERNGPLVPWAKFCEKWGHYFRPDGTCVCGEKGQHVSSTAFYKGKRNSK